MSTLLIGIDASRACREQMTGTERYARRVIDGLLTLPSPVRFRLYLDRVGPIPTDWTRVEIRPIPFPRLWTHLRLAYELRQNPVSLLFVPAHVLPFRCPVPAVVTVHDLGYRYEPDAHPLAQRLYLELGTRRSVRQARLVIAISQATARDLTRFYRVPDDRIRIVSHGVDERFFPRPESERAAVRQRYGLARPFLLFVGTLQPRKNIVRLVQAFELLARSEEELDLVLAGKRGWLAGPIEQALSSSPVRHRIHWLGHVAEEDLPALYSAAEVFVYPSLYEGFGLPVLEAMASGVPVVTTRRGALEEIAGPALFCNPLDPRDIAEAIRAARELQRRARLVAAGQEYARRFTWHRTANETLAVLLEAVGTP